MRILLLFHIIGVLAAINMYAADTIILKSKFLPETDTVLIFKPFKIKESGDKYPAVFLFHGLNGNYKTWNKYLNLQKLSAKYNLFIICPDGLKDLYYLNSPVKEDIKYMDFFTQELYSYILSNYSVDTTRIFITGNSMGGYGALNIYLHYPALFWAGGSISGILDLNYSSSKYTRLSEILGDYSFSKDVFHQHSVPYIFNNIKISDSIRLFINCGHNDPFFNMNSDFTENCKKKNVILFYHYSEGGHNKEYWTEALRLQIDIFFTEVYPRHIIDF